MHQVGFRLSVWVKYAVSSVPLSTALWADGSCRTRFRHRGSVLLESRQWFRAGSRLGG